MTRLILICFGAASLMASIAIADQPTQAEELYNQGQAAFDRSDYPSAIVKWQASYTLSGASGLLFNLAQAYRLEGDCKQALSTYRQFVTIDPKATKRALANDFIHDLEPKCGAPVQAPSVDRPIANQGRAMKLAGWVTGGAGVALFAIGLGFGHRASTLGDTVTSACAVSCEWSAEKATDAAGHRDATIGWTFDVLGVLALAGGAALYYVGDRKAESTVSVLPRHDGAVVSWSGSW